MKRLKRLARQFVMFRRYTSGKGFTLYLNTPKARWVLKIEADWGAIESAANFTLRTPRSLWSWLIPFPERESR